MLPTPSEAVKTAQALALPGPVGCRKPMALILALGMVTGVIVPAELMTPALPLQPLLTALNLVLTAVMAMPATVSLGENFPFPTILHCRVPLAAGGGMALPTPASTTVSSVADKRQTPDTPSTFRNMVSPDRPRERSENARPLRMAGNAAFKKPPAEAHLAPQKRVLPENRPIPA